MQKEYYKGISDYDHAINKFIPDEGLKKIRSMLKTMELCLADDNGEGSFYYRLSDDSWWHLVEYETSDSLLYRVTREHIEEKYPYVECDNRTPVDWLS